MANPPPLPSTFGKYRILRTIGRGGMGTVYLAQDTQLDRRIALKVPHFDEDDGPQILQRFQREAKIAADLYHSHICPVYEIGCINHIHYLTMPFIEGKPLSQLIDSKNPWEPRRAAEMLRKVALAIQVMHQRGLMHRDLKPSNIMIREDTGEPVVMDFGLARAIQEKGAPLTVAGAALGTPAYMSPEQLLNDRKELGPGTDIYALGAILYQLVTGRPPFTGPLEAVFYQIMEGTPEKPSVIRPGLDPPIDMMCMKSLSKKVKDRYLTMADFAAALGAYTRMIDKRTGEMPAFRERAVTPAPETLPEVSSFDRTRGYDDRTHGMKDQTVAPTGSNARRIPSPKPVGLILGILFLIILILILLGLGLAWLGGDQAP